jgi:hypothetical protein
MSTSSMVIITVYIYITYLYISIYYITYLFIYIYLSIYVFICLSMYLFIYVNKTFKKKTENH